MAWTKKHLRILTTLNLLPATKRELSFNHFFKINFFLPVQRNLYYADHILSGHPQLSGLQLESFSYLHSADTSVERTRTPILDQ